MKKTEKACPLCKGTMQPQLTITRNNSGQIFRKCSCGFASTEIERFER